MISRQVNEGRQLQGTHESILYALTTTPWGAAPSNVVVTVTDLATSTDVTATTLSGPANVNGDVVTLKMTALTAGHIYHVAIQFDSGADTFEAYFEIQAEA